MDLEEPNNEDLHDACGVYGVILSRSVAPETLDLARTVCDGLTALQHRGTESSGMVGSNGTDGEHFSIYKGKGLVREVYNSEEKLAKLQDSVVCIGHNRYSTAGLKDAINCIQPFVIHTVVGLVAVAHNGELVDAERMRKQVLKSGVGLSTDTDSELIAQIISQKIAARTDRPDDEYSIAQELLETMHELTLAYSLLVMTYDRIYAIRDPWANRPLCLGEFLEPMNVNGVKPSPIAYVAASETCALHMGASFVREVLPGEIVELSRDGIKSVGRKTLAPETPLAMCVFELIYFARPDSKMMGKQIFSVRRSCGAQLAKESPVNAISPTEWVVSNVPDSANPAALGYAAQSGLPYVPVLWKNPYVGRTFIQPNTKLRKSSVIKKFGPLSENFEGKNVVLVDDSIVRGNTMTPIVKLLRDYGAKEVHIRVASPPVRYPCYMGINIPRASELIAHKLESCETAIANHVNADSVNYLSVEGLLMAVQDGDKTKRHCTACLTGDYPVDKVLDW